MPKRCGPRPRATATKERKRKWIHRGSHHRWTRSSCRRLRGHQTCCGKEMVSIGAGHAANFDIEVWRCLTCEAPPEHIRPRRREELLGWRDGTTRSEKSSCGSSRASTGRPDPRRPTLPEVHRERQEATLGWTTFASSLQVCWSLGTTSRAPGSRENLDSRTVGLHKWFSGLVIETSERRAISSDSPTRASL